MSTATTNYGLIKPDDSELVSIETINGNMDTLDTELKQVESEAIDNKVVANLRQTVVQAVANTTFTAITFTTEDFDSHNGHDNAVNSSRYTVPLAGVYELSGGIVWANNSTGVRYSEWRKGGTVIPNSSSADTPNAGGVAPACVARTILVELNAGEYIELYGWQSSGGSLNTSAVGGADGSSMSVKRIRALVP